MNPRPSTLWLACDQHGLPTAQLHRIDRDIDMDGLRALTESSFVWLAAPLALQYTSSRRVLLKVTGRLGDVLSFQLPPEWADYFSRRMYEEGREAYSSLTCVSYEDL